MARRETPEINAGSMADIAFLLLIFFLVTTTMNVDSGISKKLSEKPPPDYKPPIIKEKNIFEVNINRNNDLLVEGDIMGIKEIKEAAIKFIDNGGGLGKPGEDGTPGLPCDYCEGERSEFSSDHPIDLSSFSRPSGISYFSTHAISIAAQAKRSGNVY